MVRYKKLLLSLFVFLINNSILNAQGTDTREILNFNTNWAFHSGTLKGAYLPDFDDSEWEKVSIPHVMRIEKKHDGGGKVFQGIGWYRRYFKLPQNYRNKRLTIQFEGVQMNCEIYLNGDKIQDHFGGYLGFTVNITDRVKFTGNNVLTLKVSNINDPLTPPGKPMSGLDFNYYGGIYRNVNLLSTEKLYVSDPLEVERTAGGGLYVSFPEVNKNRSKVHIQTHLINHYNKNVNTRLVSSIIDKNHHIVAKIATQKTIFSNGEKVFQQELIVNNPKLWHPDNPYLYELVTEVYQSGKILDKIITPIGIRSIAFRSPSGKTDGFYLNGKKLYLRGANRHQSYQYVGDAATNAMQYRDALQLKKGGFNAVRAAHYPASPAFLDACDRLGLLVIECQPGWQYYTKDTVFVNRTFDDIRRMVRRDRNRPSVFLWETSLNESPTPREWMERAVEVAHEEMPGDQMFTADDLNERSKAVYDVFYKVIKPDGTDPYPAKPSLTREWGDTWWADVRKENGLRSSRAYTEKGMINQAIKRQNALNGTADEKEGGYWDHAGLDANPRLGGHFLWSYNDYTRGMDSTTAFSGVVDKDRYPKFSYYQLKAMQDAHNPSYGPMVFIASYNNREDLDSSIVVFSNCEIVRLYRNNQLVGQITREENSKTAPFISAKNGSPLFNFNLKGYKEGTLKAEGVVDGRVVCTYVVATPEKPDHLEIEVKEDPITPISDGYAMFPVYIKVCDKNGTLISNKQGLEHYTIALEVKGEGWLIGGNVPESGIKLQQTEGGIAYALIRTKDRPGTISISASSENIKNAQKTIVTTHHRDNYVPDGKHFDWKSEYENEKSNLAINNGQAAIEQIDNNKIDLSKADISSLNEKKYGNIIDGDITSVWTAANSNFPLSFLIDLKENYNLQGYQIFWGKDSDWYTHSIEVSSDNKDWTALRKENIVSGQDYVLNTVAQSKSIRYFRLKVFAIRPESSKVAIREIQVFGVRSN